MDAALLGMDSVDSSGWRNRAARGIVQLPGRGDRLVADLGKWRGRAPSNDEWAMLAWCPCPACQAHGLDGLRASKIDGFAARATHNLWTLLAEARWIDEQLSAGTYVEADQTRIDNSIYRPLIDQTVVLLQAVAASRREESAPRRVPGQDATGGMTPGP